MAVRNWKVWRPNSLQEAVEGCVMFAQQRQRQSVDQLADLVAENPGTVYKWMSTGNIPARKIAGFEHACRCHYVSDYLAASAHKMVIDLPTGRLPGASDINALQLACTEAVAALIAFAEGKQDGATTIDFLTAAIHRLAIERGHVGRSQQPELDFT